MIEHPDKVVVERGAGEQIDAGAMSLPARYRGKPVTLKVSAAVLDGFHIEHATNVEPDRLNDGAFAAIEAAATKKAQTQQNEWHTLDIEVHDIR